MIIHRLVIDYASQRISNNFFLNLFRVIRFTFMFLDDKNSQIGIELHVENQFILYTLSDAVWVNLSVNMARAKCE